MSRSRWGEATDEPTRGTAREDARPTRHCGSAAGRRPALRCDWRRARIRCGGCGSSQRARCITIWASNWSACARPPTSTAQAKSKKRSQFRVASKNIAALYETVETGARLCCRPAAAGGQEMTQFRSIRCGFGDSPAATGAAHTVALLLGRQQSAATAALLERRTCPDAPRPPKAVSRSACHRSPKYFALLVLFCG